MFKNISVLIVRICLVAVGPYFEDARGCRGECAHHWYTPTHPQLLLLFPLMCTAHNSSHTITVIFSERLLYVRKISSVFVNKVAQTAVKYTHLHSEVRLHINIHTQ